MQTDLAPISTQASRDDSERLDELLRRRHSCRAFLPEPVPRQENFRFFGAPHAANAFRTARAPLEQVVTWVG